MRKKIYNKKKFWSGILFLAKIEKNNSNLTKA